MKRLTANIAICCILMLYLPAGYAQTVLVDSLKKKFTTQTSDSARAFTLMELSQAYTYYYPDSCLKYALQAQSLAERIKNDDWIFWAEVAIHNAWYVFGNYPQELACCYKSLALAQKIKDPYVSGFSDGMFSNYYQNIGEYETSLQYYRKVVTGAVQMFPDDISIVCANFSGIFNDMGQHDSALLYARKAYEGVRSNRHIHLGNDNGAFEKSAISLALANAFAGKAVYDSALLHYRYSLSLAGNWDINTLDDYNGIAAVYKALGQADSAIWYAKKVADSRLGKLYAVGLLRASSILADGYESQQKNDSALKYTKLASGLKDSLWNRDKMNVIKNLTAGEQNRQNELAAAKSALQHRYTLYFLLSGFVMLLITTAIVIRNKRQQQIQQMRNSIAADLHDDIGSTLTHISILSELSRKSVHPDNEASKFLTRLNQQVYATGQALDDIIRNVRVRDDSMEEILLRMRRFSAELFDAEEIEYKLNFDEKLTVIKICMEQRHDLYLIFKEALNNISKHAAASCVRIDLFKENNCIRMRIEDNGKGIRERNSHRSGMNNMLARAEKWGGQLQLYPGQNSGTIVLLTLPVKK